MDYKILIIDLERIVSKPIRRVFIFATFLIIISAVYSCGNSTTDNPESRLFLKAAMGGEKLLTAGNSPSDSFFKFIGESRLVDAASDLGTDLRPDNLMKAIRSFSALGDSLNAYKCFRLLESVTTENDEDLLNQLIVCNSHSSTSSNSPFFNLLSIEHAYLAAILVTNSIRATEKRAMFRKYLELYPSSLRLKYLEANLSLSFGDTFTAISAYRELLQKNYCRGEILKRLTAFYLITNSDAGLKTTSSLHDQYFPQSCDLAGWYMKAKQGAVTIDGLLTNNCGNTTDPNDSIIRSAVLGHIYLNSRRFKEIDSVCTQYEASDSFVSTGRLREWQIGEFYDMRLRLFFLRKQYELMLWYAVKNVGYNNKINVESNDDFRQLVYSYYVTYYGSERFEEFYKEHFLRLLNQTHGVRQVNKKRSFPAGSNAMVH
jgi:hypothetical protein